MSSSVCWTNHAAERFLERGLDITAAMNNWLNRVAKTFTPEAKKYSWGKGNRRITVVGVKDADNALIITVY